jgi:hypothetical protein
VSDARVEVVAAAMVGHDLQSHAYVAGVVERECLCGEVVWDVYTWRLHRAEVILAELDAA